MKARFGVISGVLGMSLCMVGLLVHLASFLGEALQSRMSLLAVHTGMDSIPSVAAGHISATEGLRQVILTAGAVFLFLAAATQGPKGRLFMILEGALVIYGAISFWPFPEKIAIALRVIVSLAMFASLWRAGLLKTRMDGVGATGLEGLGLGYLFGSDLFLLIGGVLLTIYCGHQMLKKPSFLNFLWTALNGPFACAAGTILTFQLLPDLSLELRWFFALFLIFVVGGIVPFAVIYGLQKNKLYAKN